MTRKEILEAAERCVCGERQDQYGNPENNFSVIASLWTTYFLAANEEHIGEFRPEDVAIMMALLKIARIATGNAKDDNYIDLAGYAACSGEICCNRKQ